MVLLQSSVSEMGSKAHDFALKGTDGQTYSLSSFDASELLVIVFMCNHCPYVKAIWPELIDLDNYLGSDVQFIGINSNGANPNYPDDSFEHMQAEVKARMQNFPYLLDQDQSVAKAYDAQCTPDIFVYNKDRKLIYRGDFDALKDVLNATLEESMLSVEQKPSQGCSIKWL